MPCELLATSHRGTEISCTPQVIFDRRTAPGQVVALGVVSFKLISGPYRDGRRFEGGPFIGNLVPRAKLVGVLDDGSLLVCRENTGTYQLFVSTLTPRKYLSKRSQRLIDPEYLQELRDRLLKESPP